MYVCLISAFQILIVPSTCSWGSPYLPSASVLIVLARFGFSRSTHSVRKKDQYCWLYFFETHKVLFWKSISRNIFSERYFCKYISGNVRFWKYLLNNFIHHNVFEICFWRPLSFSGVVLQIVLGVAQNDPRTTSGSAQPEPTASRAEGKPSRAEPNSQKKRRTRKPNRAEPQGAAP